MLPETICYFGAKGNNMIRQSIGHFQKNLKKILPDDLKEKFEGYKIIFYFHKDFMIGVDQERKVIKISNYAVEYIWAWTAHWVFLYDYCHDENLTLSDVISKWDKIAKKPQLKRTIFLLKLMKFNSENDLSEQAPWIIKHLNPMEVKNSIVEKVNMIFNYVLLSMILHEYGHIENEHPSVITVDDDSRRAEKEADDFSFDKYIDSLDNWDKNAIKNFAWIGVVCSQLIIFNLSHLNSDYYHKYGEPCSRLDRAVTAIESKNTFDGNDSIYAFLSLVLWLCMKNDGVTVPSNENVTFKDQYADLLVEMNRLIKKFIR